MYAGVMLLLDFPPQLNGGLIGNNSMLMERVQQFPIFWPIRLGESSWLSIPPSSLSTCQLISSKCDKVGKVSNALQSYKLYENRWLEEELLLMSHWMAAGLIYLGCQAPVSPCWKVLLGLYPTSGEVLARN